MLNNLNQKIPPTYLEIDRATKESGFTMASDILTCSLLKTLAAAKPAGKFLELGTGTGLSTAWILEGMDKHSTLISFDHDEKFLSIAQQYLGQDERLALVLSDGEDWVKNNLGQKFDYIFADTWHGKYLLLDEVLAMLNPGGLYIVDDMLPQSNWPEGHEEKAINFVKYLESRRDLTLTKQNWATGIIIAVKK
ncbi:class I SAM-dependent methyltransferase [Lewinella lacunae]|uniref:Class I SAM-dependent methyltransferase n=2 Tax=Neolewinella lacunae TaxID=1517758 RepID=A0A923PJB8_9BACT|nr:class I SAM-dependent methyltransferase [Neolewinella lacunae]MBC6995198.1 class I SAM-dependent methyltransferase [Neolewinella lacunae]